MQYPGRLISVGEVDSGIVDAIEQRLADRGYKTAIDGVFNGALASLISLFQAQHADLQGRPLKPDGIVGPNTWGALFGSLDEPSLLTAALLIARSQLGVRETPGHPNSGPQVDQYLASVGNSPGDSWCMAFVYWCFKQAAKPASCPVPKSGGVLDVLNKTRKSNPDRLITKAQAISNGALIKPGLVFILDHGHGHGHTGLVESVLGGGLTTVEGNTNPTASPEGIGVFELKRRSITDDQLVGFIDFSIA